MHLARFLNPKPTALLQQPSETLSLYNTPPMASPKLPPVQLTARACHLQTSPPRLVLEAGISGRTWDCPWGIESTAKGFYVGDLCNFKV